MKCRWWSVADEASPTTEGWSIADELKRHQRRAKASSIGELKCRNGELKHCEQRFEALRRWAKAPRRQSGLLKRYERQSKVPRWRDKVPWWWDKVPRRRAKAPRRSGLLNRLRNMWGKKRIKWEKWKRKKGLSVFRVILLVMTCVSSL